MNETDLDEFKRSLGEYYCEYDHTIEDSTKPQYFLCTKSFHGCGIDTSREAEKERKKKKNELENKKKTP
jgi:hypothetical protein